MANNSKPHNGKQGNSRGVTPDKKRPLATKGHSYYKAKNQITNDFQWWNKYPALTEGAAAFPFNRIGGEPLGLEGSPAPIPGVYVLEYLPSIGKSVSSDSPFMAQIRSVWLDMHRKFRGIGSYQVSDFGVFVFTTINAFAEIARAEKIYGYYRGVDVYNRNIPRMLIEACGVEWDDSIKHLADFRQALNRLSQRAGTVCLPKGFSAYEDAVVLATATIKDADSRRAQMATFHAPGYYVYNPTKYTTGSAAEYRLRTASGPNGRQTFDDIIADLTSCIEPLLNDNDCQRMASDVLAAYGENGVETRIAVTEEYVSPIGKDDIRLKQLHNATITCGTVIMAGGAYITPFLANIVPKGASATMPSVLDDTCLDITQENDILYSDLYIIGDGTGYSPTYMDAENGSLGPNLQIPTLQNDHFWMPTNGASNATVSATLSAKIKDRLLDTWEDNVSTEEKMEMTRFTVPVSCEYFLDDASTGAAAVKLNAWGTNVIMRFRAYRRNYNTGGISSPVDIPQAMNATTVHLFTFMSVLDSFYMDWAPIVYQQNCSYPATPNVGDQYTVVACIPYGDLDHYTSLKDDSNSLYYLHEAAILSGYRCELTQTSKFDTI